MLFSSLLFLCFFFPAVILLHRVLPPRLRNLFLLIASIFFYAWGEIRYVPLIAALALSNWLLGRVMDKRRGGWRRFFFIVALGVDLGALCFYKYADFFLETVGLRSLSPHVALPLGISFFYFSGDGLPDRRLRGPDQSGEKPDGLRGLYAAVPAADRGPRSSISWISRNN